MGPGGESMDFGKLEREVIESDLCCLCGACVASCPVNVLRFDKDSIVIEGNCISCGTCGRVCPGKGFDFTAYQSGKFGSTSRGPPGTGMGIYRSRYNLVATDREVLKTGYFGGRVSAVLINGLENGLIDAALLTDWGDEGSLSVGKAVLVKDRNGVLEMASSKYVFSPVLTLLGEVSQDPEIRSVAVVGLPCHMEALRNMGSDRTASEITSKIRYLISLNCGAPNLGESGMRKMASDICGIPADSIVSFRARKPSKSAISVKVLDSDGVEHEKEMTMAAYMNGFRRSRRWPRCEICPDYSGIASDVTFGAPLVRTEAGEQLVTSAVENGHLKKGTFARYLYQLALDLFVSGLKVRRTKKDIRRRKREGRNFPRYR
ncbi:MAG: Coenzyme F420 hydrogenase/dehydrogenase, beta subunit C-terminal domain [Thermoplasmatota archaeon]